MIVLKDLGSVGQNLCFFAGASALSFYYRPETFHFTSWIKAFTIHPKTHLGRAIKSHFSPCLKQRGSGLAQSGALGRAARELYRKMSHADRPH
jgi:hypothetical protein